MLIDGPEHARPIDLSSNHLWSSWSRFTSLYGILLGYLELSLGPLNRDSEFKYINNTETSCIDSSMLRMDDEHRCLCMTLHVDKKNTRFEATNIDAS